MTHENKAWQSEAQMFVPKWKTDHPLSLEEILATPIFDTHGRVVTEDPQVPNIANVPFDIKIAPFKDERQGLLVNSSSFLKVTQNFTHALEIISYLRSAIHPYGKKNTTEKIIEVASAGIMLPQWLVLKADDPLENGHIHPAITAAAKICRGIGIPLGDLPNSVSKTPAFLANADVFVAEVHRSQGLVSVDNPGMACPAPDRMQKQVADVLLTTPVTTDNAKEILQLTDEDIKRVKKLGFAQEYGVRAWINYHRIQREFSDMRHLSPRAREELKIKAKKYENDYHKAEKWANESLKRKKPQSN